MYKCPFFNKVKHNLWIKFLDKLLMEKFSSRDSSLLEILSNDVIEELGIMNFSLWQLWFIYNVLEGMSGGLFIASPCLPHFCPFVI